MFATKTMRLALLVAVLACCAVMIQARPADMDARKGRSLLYSCKDAQGLAGNCDALCGCVDKKGAKVDDCKGKCQACVDATKSCPSDDKLPGPCATYSGYKEVNDCINGQRRLF